MFVIRKKGTDLFYHRKGWGKLVPIDECSVFTNAGSAKKSFAYRGPYTFDPIKNRNIRSREDFEVLEVELVIKKLI